MVIPVIVDAITSWLASIYIILGFRYGYSWFGAFGPVLLSAPSQASHRLMHQKLVVTARNQVSITATHGAIIYHGLPMHSTQPRFNSSHVNGIGETVRNFLRW
jgi:hypothetical protein